MGLDFIFLKDLADDFESLAKKKNENNFRDIIFLLIPYACFWLFEVQYLYVLSWVWVAVIFFLKDYKV